MHWTLVVEHWSFHMAIPLLSSIFRHDPAQRIDIRFQQFIFKLMELLPGVPLRADELAGDPITLRRSEIDAQPRAFFERHAASFSLLERPCVKRFANGLFAA